MTIEEHENILKKTVADLAATQVDDALLTSLDLIGLVKLRLAEQGTRADGSAFSDYSPIYSKVRQANGLGVAFKDFNVTGQLYASIRPELKAQGFGKVAVDITVRGADNQLKVIGQLRRDGNILEPSKDEIQEATLAYSRRRIARVQQLLT